MYVYKVTFTTKETVEIRANSPRECAKLAEDKYQRIVLNIKYLRGK